MDSLEPVLKDNIEFCKHLPQIKYGVQNTPQQQMIITKACKFSDFAYKQNGKIIYRKYFYSPNPEKHSKYEHDVIITPDNVEVVTSFIANLLGIE